jgi:hypothetical protein
MQKYSIKVNRETIISKKQNLTGQEILEIAGLTPIEDYELLLKTNEKGYEPIQLTETVDLTLPGLENFSAKLYKTINIFIEDVKYELDEYYSTPNDLLKLAGYNNKSYFLTQIKNRGVEIGYKENNDANHKIQLKNGAKFCLQMREEQCVIINTSPHVWLEPSISFEEVIKLAFGTATNINSTYTVTYVKGVDEKPTGSIIRGGIVSVKHKMIFDATLTNKS